MTYARGVFAGLTALVALTASFAGLPHFAAAQQPTAKAAQEPTKDQPVSFWMERKLHLSQNVLAGITSGDFEKVTTSAQAMRSLNKIEAFLRGRTPGYRTQLQIFEESLDEIIRQAEKDNLEGAALGFTQLTISCVNCHKQLRAEK